MTGARALEGPCVREMPDSVVVRLPEWRVPRIEEDRRRYGACVLGNGARAPRGVRRGTAHRPDRPRPHDRGSRPRRDRRAHRVAHPPAHPDVLSERGGDVDVLVTGGTGFIGLILVPRLVEDGRTVRVLQRRPGPAPEGVEVVAGDVTDRE